MSKERMVAVHEFCVMRQRLTQKKMWRELTGVAAVKTTSTGTGDVLRADWLAEQTLAPVLVDLWPNLPLLCEEAETSGVRDLIPGTTILPCTDATVDLPSNLITLDGVDGSAQYMAGLFEMVAILGGRIEDGKPTGGLAMLLHKQEIYSTVGPNGEPGVFMNARPHSSWRLPHRRLKQCCIGTDGNGAVDPIFQDLVISPLMKSSETSYPLQFPSGAGALAVLRGNIAAYVTSNARNWDLAATAALCLAASMIVRCLDGSEVPWNRVRMPPVVFARDEETFAYVQKTAN